MNALISGSLAFDTIMVFPERFRDHILPEKVHMLNVSFLVPELRREFGGCAGNIAYNLRLLGGQGRPLGTVGEDFETYRRWLDQCGIDQQNLLTIPGTYTAQAYITTDLDDNQITAFHPGAMNHAHDNPVRAAPDIGLGVVAPNGRQGMLDHARQFAEAGIPFLFDPGQGLPMFNGGDLMAFIDQATWVAVNEYEAALLEERTGHSLERLAGRVAALIVTRGARGSLIYTGGAVLEIPPARPDAVRDPTGCGDAYRAGLIFGLQRELDWALTGRVASLMGAIKVAHPGTQNHRFERAEFETRFRDAFGMALA
jgi:adenosine kinase